MLIQNELQCNKCKDIIFSAHVHDYKTCKCGSISVDGGLHYLRRVGDIYNFTDRSMSMKNADVKACIEEVDRLKASDRNSFGLVLGVIRVLRDRDYLNMERFK